MNTAYYIIGVSGCGKSTIGKALANKLEISFKDGDDFHPTENIQKMSDGFPLNDQDRQPWLENINTYAQKSETDIVIACSALKKKYRTTLSKNLKTIFLLLDGSFDLIRNRLENRKGHFMPPALLQSQFDALEKSDECICIDVDQSVEEIIEDIISKTKKPK